MKDLLSSLISMGLTFGIGAYPCLFWFGDYPYPEEET